ncbi:MAG: flagellar biosynthesis protein FliQ [Deltaproteobacteria bacterium]|nr:flagellar biosynthesis protein FliQ [Deltaproteobacteria bacterium]MBN2688789.1 flagellar biosynthesis protein FliQ [Deltaproteobacteria bacterium]
MSIDLVMGLADEAIKVTLLLSAPMLIVGLVIGLIISIFQAVTQIQEMTLTFVPKIVAVMIALLIALPWMVNLIITYTQNLFASIPLYIK